MTIGLSERAGLARAWARALATTAYTAKSRRDTESLLRDLLDGLFDTLTAEEFSSDPAREIGTRLIAEHFTSEQSLSRTVEVLGQALLTHPALQSVADLPVKVVALLGAIAAGHSAQLRIQTLDQQEQVKRALLQPRRGTGTASGAVEADRIAAEQLLKVVPAREMARLNRRFLRRAVLYMIDAGIRQFLDLGSGIPTVGNVHEIAQTADPSCRVLYVDIDAIAVAHSELLLAENDNAEAIQADLCRPGSILAA